MDQSWKRSHTWLLEKCGGWAYELRCTQCSTSSNFRAYKAHILGVTAFRTISSTMQSSSAQQSDRRTPQVQFFCLWCHLVPSSVSPGGSFHGIATTRVTLIIPRSIVLCKEISVFNLLLPWWFMYLAITQLLKQIRTSQHFRAGRKNLRVRKANLNSSRQLSSDLTLRVHMPLVTPHCS